MRQEKQFLLDEIKEKINQSDAIVFTRYSSLTPDLSADFRFELAKSGGSFLVVRKRVFIRAAEESGIPLTQDMLRGHIGIMFAGGDPIASTKALYGFVKDYKGMFEVLGGQFEGEMVSATDVQQISTLPSEGQMRSQFLGLLETPMGQTLSVMEAVLTSLLYCLENKGNQEGSK